MRVFDKSKICTCSHCAFTAQFSYRKLLSSLAKYELSHRWPCVSRRPATVVGVSSSGQQSQVITRCSGVLILSIDVRHRCVSFFV